MKTTFPKRFWQYQKERFPLLAHIPLIAAFTFSAASYSRLCRGVGGFIGWADLTLGVFVTVSMFLLVRIFDEFKDREEDRLHRSYLPVPRGLVSLRELKGLGLAIVGAQIVLIGIFQPRLLLLYGIALGYLCLMGVEFFIPNWLKRHQLAYIASHMVIIPLIDLYASGLDWRLHHSAPHIGLGWFFAVSFFNGVVLEFGRKIRTPATEEANVLSYTRLYGIRGGVLLWIGLMALTAGLATGAAGYVGYGPAAGWTFGALFTGCSLPGWFFLHRPTERKSKLIEYASAAWTLLMYLSLGGIPMLFGASV